MDKKKLKQLADYAVREGLERSEDGRWAVSYEELLYHFGVDGCNKDTKENRYPHRAKEVFHCR